MTDKQLRQNILDELEFDPSFDAEYVGVAVDNNVVQLSGHVKSCAQKLAVLAAARRVRGVHAIADEIEVRYPDDAKTGDDQLASRALRCLKWNAVVSNLPIDVVVHDGYVSLLGTVNWEFEKRAAEECISKLTGVRSVSNAITLKPRTEVRDLKAAIETALKRRARVDSNAITISIKGHSRVVLEGKVDDWDERRAVEDAAWSAAGVEGVDNHLIIG
jgi:osmotically-inducible protein OsmY